MDAAGTVERGDLLVRDGVIAALGPATSAALAGQRPDAEFDATGSLVLPGFVHGHLHLCQTLFRGLAEQSDLLAWLRERIWPLEAAHTPRSIAASARMGVAELVAGGVTCINDMGSVRHTEAIGEVLEASGIRAVFGKALMDQGEGVPPALIDSRRSGIEESLALAARFHGAAGGRLSVSLAPRFILSCSEGLWRDAAAAAAERALTVHTHLAESPGEAREVEQAVATSAARYFEARGVLGRRFVGAHGIWLDGEELAMIAAADAALVHCPGSNLKLGSGLAHVRAWRDRGIRSGLGSDGGACNNRLDTFHEMSLAGLVSRVRPAARGAGSRGDAGADALAAREVVSLATCDGARALGLGDAIGSLEVGKQADLAVVDVSGPITLPPRNAIPTPRWCTPPGLRTCGSRWWRDARSTATVPGPRSTRGRCAPSAPPSSRGCSSARASWRSHDHRPVHGGDRRTRSRGVRGGGGAGDWRPHRPGGTGGGTRQGPPG